MATDPRQPQSAPDGALDQFASELESMLAGAEVQTVAADRAPADPTPIARATPAFGAPIDRSPTDQTAPAGNARPAAYDAPRVRPEATAPPPPVGYPVATADEAPSARSQPASGEVSSGTLPIRDAGRPTPDEVAVVVEQAAPVVTGVDRIPISRLIEAVPLDWGDAVAITCQLIEQLVPDPAHRPRESLPSLDGIELEETGRLRAALEPEGETTLVAGVARLFQDLLGDADRPAGLRGLLTQAGSLVPVVPFEDLTRELARWERTNRERRLKGLYERFRLKHPLERPVIVPTVAATLPTSPEPEGATTRLESEIVKAPEGQRARTKETVLGILGLSAIVGLLLLYFVPRWFQEEAGAPPLGARPLRYLVTLPDAANARISIAPLEAPAVAPAARPPGPMRTPGPAVTSVAQPPPAPVTTATTTPASPVSAPSSVPAPPPVQRPSRIVDLTNSQSVALAEQEFRRAQTLFDSRDYRKAAEAFQRVMRLLDNDSNVISELRVRANELAAASRRFAVQNAAPATRIYTSADASVTGPAPMGTFLPPPPPEDAPSDRVIILHVLVDERGAVESAHVLSTRNHYRDRWWVVTAKAWRFQPATRDGQPVRYLRRVPIFDDMPER